MKEEKETGREEKEDRKDGEDQKENGRIQVTRGTILGIIPIGTARRMILRLIRGRLLNFLLVPSLLCSQFETELRGVF